MLLCVLFKLLTDKSITIAIYICQLFLFMNNGMNKSWWYIFNDNNRFYALLVFRIRMRNII